jgi:hypothetical protein
MAQREARTQVTREVPFPNSPCSGYVASTHADVLGLYVSVASIGGLTAGAIRSHQFTVRRDVVDGEHPSHVHLVESLGLTKKQKHDLRSKLSAATRWIAGPTWVA